MAAKDEVDKALKADAVKGSDKHIYVMRHGRTALDAMKRSDGWLDFPLTDEGRRGTMKAQQYLKDLPTPLKRIYAPTLKRTHETAHIIQSGMGLKPPEIVPSDIARTWNLGTELIGSKKKPSKPIVKFFMRHPDKTPAGGESMNDFCKRFLDWFKERQDEDGPILLVLSGSNIREISKLLSGDRETYDLDESGLLRLTPIGNMLAGTVIFGGKHSSEEEPENLWSYGS